LNVPAGKVTVVMPAFNEECYIAEAINSILCQTHRDFTLLIFNDGSTDRTEEIIREACGHDSRIQVISKPNRGYSRCLVEGFCLAETEYVARMDADDIALPDRLQLQLDFLERNPDCVVVGGAIVAIDKFGDSLRVVAYPKDHDSIVDSLLHLGRCSIAHPAAMLRKKPYFDAGGYRVEFEPAEDFDLWLRLSEIGKLSNLTESVIRYRLHSRSVSHMRWKLQRENTQKAHHEACARRNISISFPSDDFQSFPGKHHCDSDAFVEFANMASDSGYTLTALKYVKRLVWNYPFRSKTWRCFARFIVRGVIWNRKYPSKTVAN
jgi:glycosyltransferase involved in cell wall biosynthesis